MIGKQEVVIKNLVERLKRATGFGGATIMEDGRVGLIVDLQGLFKMEQTL